MDELKLLMAKVPENGQDVRIRKRVERINNTGKRKGIVTTPKTNPTRDKREDGPTRFRRHERWDSGR